MEIKLYTIEGCPHCDLLKEFLAKEKVSYLEFDVDYDTEAWHRAMSLADGKDIVPVLECNGKVAYGAFNDSLKNKVMNILKG